jgi:hypothetical protein
MCVLCLPAYCLVKAQRLLHAHHTVCCYCYMMLDDEIVEANADMILEWIRILRYWLTFSDSIPVSQNDH